MCYIATTWRTYQYTTRHRYILAYHTSLRTLPFFIFPPPCLCAINNFLVWSFQRVWVGRSTSTCPAPSTWGSKATHDRWRKCWAGEGDWGQAGYRTGGVWRSVFRCLSLTLSVWVWFTQHMHIRTTHSQTHLHAVFWSCLGVLSFFVVIHFSVCWLETAVLFLWFVNLFALLLLLFWCFI